MRFDSDSSGTSPLSLENEDVIAAMKEMQGYIDITPADFVEIYRFAYNHALERIACSVQAQTVMTREVIWVRKDTSLLETAKLMAEANISGVPVVNNNNNQVVGVISEKDFLQKMGAQPEGSFMGVISKCLENKGCLALPIKDRLSRDIMSTPALTVDAQRPLSAISELFAEKKINRVPVVDSEGRLVGIVSRADIVKSFFTKVC